MGSSERKAIVRIKGFLPRESGMALIAVRPNMECPMIGGTGRLIFCSMTGITFRICSPILVVAMTLTTIESCMHSYQGEPCILMRMDAIFLYLSIIPSIVIMTGFAGHPHFAFMDILMTICATCPNLKEVA